MRFQWQLPVRALQLLKSQRCLEFGMGTIAEGAVFASFAATEVNSLCFGGFELYR